MFQVSVALRGGVKLPGSVRQRIPARWPTRDSVSSEGIDHTGWISKIGPSRRAIANHEQSMRLVRQYVTGEIDGAQSFIAKVRLIAL